MKKPCSLSRVWFCLWLIAASFGPVSFPAMAQSNSSQTLNFIDVHNRLFGGKDANYIQAAAAALRKMNDLGIARMIIMPSPGHQEVIQTERLFATVRQYPYRFRVLSGGGKLNVIIQEAKKKGQTTARMKDEFEKKS